MVEQMTQSKKSKNRRSSGRPSRRDDDQLARLATEVLTCAVALAGQLDDAQELSRVSGSWKIPDTAGSGGEFRALTTVDGD
jgi:hypothetical protein